jgi:hypothetical protein
MDRRDALSLPLVRDVFEVFSDATLIDARREQTPPAIESDASDTADEPGQGDPSGK